MTYRQQVLRYFRQEFSDVPLLEIFRLIRVYQDSGDSCQQEGSTTLKDLRSQGREVSPEIRRWTDKTKQIIAAHERAGHSPSIAAAKIALVLKAVTGTSCFLK